MPVMRVMWQWVDGALASLSQLDETRRFLVFAAGSLLLIVALMSGALIPPQGQALWGLDIRAAIWTWFQQGESALRQGHLPIWDPYHLNGYPFLGNPQAAFFYPPTWMAMALPDSMGMTWFAAFHLWWGCIGMLLLVRAERSTWTGAVLAALSFGLNYFMFVRNFSGHVGVSAVASWFPWLLVATKWSLRGGRLRQSIGIGIALSMSFLAGHTSSLVYVLLGWTLYLGYLAKSTGQWRPILGQATAGSLWSLGFCAAQLIPTAELMMQSGRAHQLGLQSVQDFSLHPLNLINLVLPNFPGNPVRAGNDWGGGHFGEQVYYLGIFPLLSFILLLDKNHPRYKTYVGILVLTVLLAMGKYAGIYGLIYRLFPPFRLVRVPARAMFIFISISCVIVADVFTFRQRERAENQTIMPASQWWGRIAIFLLALLEIIVIYFFFEARESGAPWLVAQIFNWLILAVLLIGSAFTVRIFFSSASMAPRRQRRAAATMIVWCLFDVVAVSVKFVRPMQMGPNQMWSDAKAFLGDSDERIISTTERDVALELPGQSFFSLNDASLVQLAGVNSYNPLSPIGVSTLLKIGGDAMFGAFGVKYILAGDRLTEAVVQANQLELVQQTHNAFIYERLRSAPMTRLVHTAETVPDLTDALARIQEPGFDFARTAIVDVTPPCQLSGDDIVTGDVATVTAHEDAYWQIETHSDQASILLLSETAYPGWMVAVDSQPAQSLKVYGVIKGVCVPAGSHLVEWTYRPMSLYLGMLISALFLVSAASVIADHHCRRRA